MASSKKILLLSAICLLTVLLYPLGVSAQQGDSVRIHSIVVKPVEGQLYYRVEGFASVLDSNRSPILDIKNDLFQFMEDGNPVQVDQITVAPRIPLNIVAVLDTSGSMAGLGMQQSKEAAGNFVNNLNVDDEVSVITFNENLILLNEFTNDHGQVVNKLETIDAVPYAGTCLYDALYRSIQLISQTPSGRRVILGLTDGKDELLSGERCSSVTVDDVINSALEQNTPLYIIGLGRNIDDKDLGRMTVLTGGEFFYSPDPAQLDDIFTLLLDHLRYQYFFSYITQTTPGIHTLLLKVNLDQADVLDSKTFFAPEFPPTIIINLPGSVDTLNLPFEINITLVGNIQEVDSVRFEVNGEMVSTDSESPYSVAFSEDSLPPGEITFTAVAVDQAGTEIARSQTNIRVMKIQTAQSVDENETIDFDSLTSEDVTTSGKFVPYILIGGGFIGAIIAVIFLVIRNKKGNQQFHDGSNAPDNISQTMVIGESDNVTEVFITSNIDSKLPVCTVLFSDDPLRIGERIEITNLPFRIGRSSQDNDLVLPKDRPVSRHHAAIDFINNRYVLFEIATTSEENHKPKYPTYGTFINGKKLELDEQVELKDGDEVSLGPRFKIRVNFGASVDLSQDITMDDLRLT
ncbi:MAG TPA: VWA domain-containing protein [Anaerolineaceae bacterium]|nr:VWA domain-containing protein [Anaerolineaceae bacterium]HQF46783.1 VWA domain-containing protein [Anaerolineaceae bacterium]